MPADEHDGHDYTESPFIMNGNDLDEEQDMALHPEQDDEIDFTR
jgi:hypothetical protein